MNQKEKNFSEAVYSVIDFETTGTSPPRSRAIEIGIVRIENGKITDSYHSLINPGQYLPPFITSLTGITNEDLIEAPAFENICQNVKDFIDGSILVGHNLPFDFAFLKSEFEMADIQLPKLDQICTLKISRKIFPELKSKSLGSMISHFNIIHKNAHRALGDATATAKLFLKLIEKLKDDYNYENISDLLDFQVNQQISKSFRLVKKKLVGDLASLPDSPGVYFFKDAKENIIYIGKAKSLKSRVKNYFSSSAPRKTRKIVRKANRLGFQKTNSELNALVLEAELIKLHKPPLNTLLKKFSQNYFLRINLNHDFPDIKVETDFDFDGNDYFGPYSNRVTANSLREIVDKTFTLRECTDKELNKNKKCYLLDIKRCSAPCISEVNSTEYKIELENVYEFLSGKNQNAVNRLLNKMKDFSEKKKYEEAAEMRDTVNLILNQLTRTSILAEPINKVNALIEIKDSEFNDYILFLEGRVYIKDYFLKDQDFFDAALDDYYDNTFQLLSGMEERDLEKIKISLSWLVKNRNKIKVHYLKDYNTKENLFRNMKFPAFINK
ncbi:MAG: GIY-YIG nuclease family protein [Ignavibacteriales bacterium]|nr:GIY-YIG nuclease family protein [Ignavibacteriales bacterium]MBK7980023.1 GIY-YIG nuclease family protein [Ignavibacteriota bacterium]